MRRWREIAREGLNDFLFLVSRPAIGQALCMCVPWGVTACYVHIIPDIFCAGTRTIPDRASATHTNGDFSAKLRPVNLEGGAWAYRVASVSDYGAV